MTLEHVVALQRIRPQAILTFGFIALILANAGSYLVQRKLDVPENLADGISGFLMGIAITTLLIGIWMKSRELRTKGKLP